MKTKVKLTNAVLPFTVTGTQQVNIQPNDIEPGYIASGSGTPTGNNPGAYNNYAFVWLNDSATSVPWGQVPVASASVSNTSPLVTGSFGAHQYVVAYSVGPAVTVGGVPTYPNIAATAAIPADWNLNNCAYQSSSITPSTVQAGLMTASYVLPTGFNPSVAGSWIAVFAGTVQPYNNTGSLLGYGAITATTSQGSAVIGGLNIAPNQPYTLALFNSGYNATQASLVLTSLAAVSTFTTGASLS